MYIQLATMAATKNWKRRQTHIDWTTNATTNTGYIAEPNRTEPKLERRPFPLFNVDTVRFDIKPRTHTHMQTSSTERMRLK